MAKVKCEPGFTQLTKLNILDARKLTVKGAEVEVINTDHFTAPVQASFDSVNSFSMTGNHTEDFQIGRRVQLDSGQSNVNCNVSPEDLTPNDIFTVNKYDYSIITAIQYDGVITDVTIADSILTTDLEEASVDINWSSSQVGLITTTDLINSTRGYPADYVLETSGFTSSGDGGGAKWKQNGVVAQTPSQTPSQLAEALLNDANGNQWRLVMSRQLFMPKVGLISGSDMHGILKIAESTINNSSGFISVAFPPGDFEATANSEYIIDIGDNSDFSIIGNKTKIEISSGVGSILRIQRSTGWVVSGLNLFSNQLTANGFHGVAITDCQNFDYKNGEIHNSGGYGIGLQGDSTASYENCSIKSMRIIQPGADGVDFKNNEGSNRAIIIDDIYVEDPSWLNNLKVGLDIRGPATVSNIHVVFKNNVNFDMIGIRTRQTTGGLTGAEKTTITNIIVDDLTAGLQNIGVTLVESNTVQSNITVTGCKSTGFQIADDAVNLQLMNCLAINCNNGFFNSGENTKLMFCQALNCDAEGFRSSGNNSSSYLFCESINSGTYGFRSASGAINIDLAYCKASGSGTDDYSVGATARSFMCDGYTGNSTLQAADSDYVKFGSVSAIGAEALSGYIFIRDNSGALIKLAVIS